MIDIRHTSLSNHYNYIQHTISIIQLTETMSHNPLINRLVPGRRNSIKSTTSSRQDLLQDQEQLLRLGKRPQRIYCPYCKCSTVTRVVENDSRTTKVVRELILLRCLYHDDGVPGKKPTSIPTISLRLSATFWASTTRAQLASLAILHKFRPGAFMTVSHD